MNFKFKRSKMLATLLIILFTIALVAFNKGHIEDDILLMDIEALAAREGSSGVLCTGIGSLDCPISHRRVYEISEPLVQH